MCSVSEAKLAISGLDQSDLLALRLKLILDKVVRKTLQQIVIWGCVDKPPGMSFKEYFLLEKGISNVTFKKYFHRDQIHIMENDLEGSTFDITLLYNCIQLGCHRLADVKDPIWSTSSDTLEYALYSVKNLRNKIVHDSHFLKSEVQLREFISEMRKKIEFIITEAGNRYSIEEKVIDTLISESNEALSAIINRFDNQYDVNEILVKSNGLKELKLFLNRIACIDSSHIMCFRRLVDVSEIFTDLELVTVQKTQHSSVEVNVENLLEVESSNGLPPSVIIVEGVAGVGKTTLTKWIVSQWLHESKAVKNLHQYDLLLYMECRNATISNVKDFIQSLMPQTSQKISDFGIIGTVFSLKLLILVDGLDELNCSFRSLFHELVQKLNNNSVMLITTRPEKAEDIYKVIPANLEIRHLKITGLSPERRKEFIFRLNNVMQKYGESHHNVSELATFVMSRPWLSNFLTLPLNLVLLTYIWFRSPERIGFLKTSTGLYSEILNLTMAKLTQRLLANKTTCMLPETAINELLSNFLQLMCRECLISVRRDDVALNSESIKVLQENCLELNLPTEEVFHAFLHASEIQGSGLDSLEFPCAEFRDFYAALAICECLKRSVDREILENVTKGLSKILSENQIPVGLTSKITEIVESAIVQNLDRTVTIVDILKDAHQDAPDTFKLAKYQKVLLHLLVLLENNLELYAIELVRLLKELKTLNSEQWLNVVAETECDRTIVTEVKPVISKDFLCVRDSHLMAACSLLQGQEVHYVDIDISSDPSMLPHLKDLLNVLSNSTSQIKLTLLHNWQYPEHGCSDDYLQCLSKKSDSRAMLTQFMGSVKSLSSLDKSLDCLFIAIGSDYANHTNRASKYLQLLVDLELLYIHITGGISIDCLPDITKQRFPIDLWFSGIDDSAVEWVGKAIRKLENNRIRSLSVEMSKYKIIPKAYLFDFSSIRFPRSTLTSKGCIALAKVLKGVMIGRDGIMVSSSELDTDEIQMMEMVYSVETGSSFRLSDEVNIWTFSAASH